MASGNYYHQDHVRVPSGASIFYEVRNEGEPAMVLCDGLGCDGFAWKYLKPLLARRHRVLHWNYRGHGQSGMPSDPTDVGVAQACDDLRRVLERLRHGLWLDEQPLKPAQVSWQNERHLRIVLREGRKRQIRRMCELVGLQVTSLKRIRIGRVTLGELPSGQWRYLGPFERFA